MEERYDSVCGIYCGACFVLAARKRNDLESIARMWNCKPDQLICYGCKSGQVSDSCKPCEIRPCAEAKGHAFCIECEAFPCKLTGLFHENKKVKPHLALVFRDLESIKEKGVAVWLDEQASRWSCKKCGASLSWYDEKCPGCGATFRNARDEAADLGLL